MLIKRLLLALFSLVATFCVLEVLVRLAHVAPRTAVLSVGRFRIARNPLIGYEPVPDYEYHGEEMYFYEFRGKSNSLGFRDKEHPVARQPGVARILVIGDSITMGLGIVDDDEAVYTRVLERVLGERGRRVEVINFGVSGYNTQQEVYSLLEKGIAYKPDLVVLGYCINDWEMLNGGIVEALHNRQKSSATLEPQMLSPLLAKSALYRFCFDRLAARGVKQLDDRAAQLGKDTVAQSFGLLAQLSAEHDFKVMVAVFPEVLAQPGDYAYPEDLARKYLFPVLQLHLSFELCAEKNKRTFRDLIFGDGMHPNKLGHACAGDAIAEFVVQNHLIPN